MPTEQDIREHLTTNFIKKIYAFETLDSTNTLAKSLKDIEHATLIITDEQFAGRGRQGRKWSSEKGKNLTFSIIVKPNVQRGILGLLPLSAGLAVAEAIEATASLRAVCKWPNDVLIENKKVCGILCETTSRKEGLFVIIGSGINVNQASFPDELSNIATSLSIVMNKEVDRLDLLNAVLERFEHWYNEIVEGNSLQMLQQWKAHSTMLGKPIIVQEGNTTRSGVAVDLTESGELILQTNSTTTKILSGDVHLVH